VLLDQQRLEALDAELLIGCIVELRYAVGGNQEQIARTGFDGVAEKFAFRDQAQWRSIRREWLRSVGDPCRVVTSIRLEIH
jgi:hypothetical protein